MDNSKKENLSKVVLNVTTYKPIPGTTLDYPVSTTVDITDALASVGIDADIDDNVPDSINGVTQIGTDEFQTWHTHFVVPEQNLNSLKAEIKSIVTAAIVNTKQLSAVENLIDSKFDEFRFKLWEQIRDGDVIK